MTMPLRRRAGWVLSMLGVCALAGQPLASAAPIFGPPLEVEMPALIPGQPTGWLWASCEGVEVLALAPEDATRTYVQNIAQQRATLDAILPRDLRITWDRPILVVLYGVDNPRPMPAPFVGLLSKIYTDRERARALENREGKPLEVRVEPRIMTGAWVPDADTVCIFNVLQQKVKAAELSNLPAPIYISYLLQSRTPPLPAWFMEGLSVFFGGATVTGAGLDAAPFTWVSPAQTQLMVKDKSMPAEFLPMAEVFAYINKGTQPTDERRRLLVRSQGALLVRWAIEGRAPGGPETLWKFTRGLRPGVDHEAWFAECFGMSTTAAVEALRAYLPGAIRKPMRVRLARDTRPPAIEIRTATPSEVARIRGEWERLSGRLVATTQPELRYYYEETARRTLATGPDDATADPELLASRGLMAVELGDDAAALPLLEAACATPKPRARAVVELARIRLAQAKAALEPEAKLDASAVAAIVDPLRTVLDANPPMARAFQVLAETFAAGSEAPAAADLALLTRGAQTIPGDASMIIAIARLMVDLGLRDEARGVIELGLAHVTDDASRRRLFAIRSAVRAPAPK